jgi:ferrous iron transport protein B
VSELASQIESSFPGLPNARWVALRLLDGDSRIAEAVKLGELGDLSKGAEEENEVERSMKLETLS